FLKERNPDIEIWAIEPPVGEMVDGLKNFDEGFVPPVFVDGNGADLLSRKMIVRPREAIEWVRRFAEIGVFAGISSGAIMAVADVLRVPRVEDHGTATARVVEDLRPTGTGGAVARAEPRVVERLGARSRGRRACRVADGVRRRVPRVGRVEEEQRAVDVAHGG